ncbi:hypothetical protein PYCC9005_002517 [Savitreella phatthalungensis]
MKGEGTERTRSALPPDYPTLVKKVGNQTVWTPLPLQVRPFRTPVALLPEYLTTSPSYREADVR